jgi:hypothetical protein
MRIQLWVHGQRIQRNKLLKNKINQFSVNYYQNQHVKKKIHFTNKTCFVLCGTVIFYFE